MEMKLIAGLLLLVSSVIAHATEIDLGPSGVFRDKDHHSISTTVPSLGLDGRAVDGSISFDITFGGNFVRVFTNSGTLFARTDLVVAAGFPIPQPNGFSHLGNGYFVDKNGDQIGEGFNLGGGFEGFRDAWDIAVFGGESLPSRPSDVYGFHFDVDVNFPGLTLDEERTVTNSFGTSFVIHDRVSAGVGGRFPWQSVFGVGPGNLPTDITTIPESGSTAVLLAIALAAVGCLRNFAARTKTTT
jgi:hypothetical protein